MEVDGCIETSVPEMRTSMKDVVCWVIWNVLKTQLIIPNMRSEWYVACVCLA